MTFREVKLNSIECEEAVEFAVRNNFPILIKGRVGCGKTSICKSGALKAGVKPENIIVESPHLKEVSDYCGLPFAIKDAKGNVKSADFLPINTMTRMLSATEPTVVILDEIDKARTANALAQILWGREINGKKIPETVRFVATANLDCDQTGSAPMKPHLLDRFWSVVEYEIEPEGWAKYMLEKYGTQALTLISFIRYQPHYLTEGQDTELALQKIKSTTPRTLENYLIMEIEANKPENRNKKGIEKLLYGCGTAFKVEYDAFKELYLSNEIPCAEDIFNSPFTAKIPTKPSQINLRYVVIAMLSAKVTKETFPNVVKYLMRGEWDSFKSLRRTWLENLKATKIELLNQYPELVVELIG